LAIYLSSSQLESNMATDPFLEGNGQITPRGNRPQHPPSPGGPLIIHQPRSYDLLLRELDTLRTRLGDSDDELESTVAELRQSHRQIEKDDGVITALQAKIAELEDLVCKQKITIANQSRAISDPKTLRHRPSFAPTYMQMAPTQHISGHETYDAPYSAGMRLTGLFDMPYSGFHAPMPGAFPAGPQAAIPPADSYQPYGYGMPVQSPTRDIMTPPTPNSYAGLDFETRMTEFGTRFQAIWAKAETFGRAYAAEPSPSKDSNLEPQVKDYVMLISDTRVASFLLGNPATRPLHVAKAINFYLVRDILKYTEVIKGFNAAVDAEITRIKKQMSHGV
jgi:hypothetical protein